MISVDFLKAVYQNAYDRKLASNKTSMTKSEPLAAALLAVYHEGFKDGQDHEATV